MTHTDRPLAEIEKLAREGEEVRGFGVLGFWGLICVE